MKKPKNYRPLLSVGADAKTVKGEDAMYITGILYLAPAREAGIGNMCPMASKGCATACLFTAGRGRFTNVKKARVDKTLLFHRNRELFMECLIYDIEQLIRRAAKAGMTPCVRLNGTSDVQWERQLVDGKCIMDWFPDVQFYDYTKIWTRFSRNLPTNLHLTFSRSESNQDKVEWVIANHPHVNIAAVFADTLPETWCGRPVISGDEDDVRFNDPKGVIVGLKAKGQAKNDTSGFVVQA
jgi:hypothetical protein